MLENGFLFQSKVGIRIPFYAVIGRLHNCLLEVLSVITRNDSDRNLCFVKCRRFWLDLILHDATFNFS